MTGFNMPPGCSVNDIPGNRPEDQKAEAFYDAFYEFEQAVRQAHPELGDTYVEVLAQWAWEKMGEAYSEGYSMGHGDEALAQTFRDAGEG